MSMSSYLLDMMMSLKGLECSICWSLSFVIKANRNGLNFTQQTIWQFIQMCHHIKLAHPWCKWWDVKHYCANHTAVLWAALKVLSTAMPTTCGLCISKAFQLHFSTVGKGSSILVTTWNCEKYLWLTRRVLEMPRESNADGPALNPTGSDTCHGTCTNMDAACLRENGMCNLHHKWLPAYCTCLVL